jgi:alpha-tubulin suppressor-like RCC1 family protein
MAGIRAQSVAACQEVSLALSGDGRVYSWGKNDRGQLGDGDTLDRLSPVLVEVLECVCWVAAYWVRCHAVTDSEDVFCWGRPFVLDWEDELRPVLVEGFGGVRVCRVFAGAEVAFAIGEAGELFSWGFGMRGTPGHGETQDQLSPSASRRCGAFG